MPPTPETEQKNFFEPILARKVPFLVVFFIVFIVTYTILFIIDFVPTAPEEETEPAAEQEETSLLPMVLDPYPQRMFIDALEKDITILNPESRAIADLDTALLSGAVRHPDSANLANMGNMFLFGHSSYLPNVLNKNFQAFNGIQELVWGDVIRIQSSDTEYLYRVQKVYKTKASEADIVLDHDSAKLTLVTCDSFGSKDERFVVEADLIEKRTL